MNFEGSEGDALEAAVDKRSVWYGIIDDEHSNFAVRWLKENRISWKTYPRVFTVLADVDSMDRYRLLPRFQNHLNAPQLNMKLTIYNESNNLPTEFASLFLSGGKYSHNAMAKSYFGALKVSRTMTMPFFNTCTPISACHSDYRQCYKQRAFRSLHRSD